MKRSKRMLVVMLTSFGILFFLTFLTFAGYGQSIYDYTDSAQDKWEYVATIDGTDEAVTNFVEVVDENSPNENMTQFLVGTWEGLYGGKKTYISFTESGAVIMRSAAFTNSINDANEKQYGYMYYDVDASTSPYQLAIFNRYKRIEALFRVANDNQIITCFDFEGDDKIESMDDNCVMMTLYRMENEK